MLRSIQHDTLDTLSDETIIERIAHLNRMLAEELPGDPPMIAAHALLQFRNMPSTSRWQVWTVWQASRMIAQAKLSWAELDSNRHVADVHITVEAGHRRHGLASKLLGLAAAAAKDIGRPLLIAASADLVPAGAAFLEQNGFEPKFQAHINQLAIADLDPALMSDWRSANHDRACGYKLELWDGPVPESELAAFAELVSVMNTAPRDELDIEDTPITPDMLRDWDACLFSNGSRRLFTCARHAASGAFAGFTELKWHPQRAAIVWQGDTGVVEAHRNRGLGRWLKAANIEALLRQNSEVKFVRSGNADSNAPMLAINRQMGFKPLIAETAWQGSAPDIAERLRYVSAGEPNKV